MARLVGYICIGIWDGDERERMRGSNNNLQECGVCMSGMQIEYTIYLPTSASGVDGSSIYPSIHILIIHIGGSGESRGSALVPRRLVRVCGLGLSRPCISIKVK